MRPFPDPPQVTTGGNQTVTAGSTVTLTCAISATPTVTSVTWYKGGVALNMSDTRITGGTVSSPTLVVSTAVREDAGFYVCGASNSIGSANSSSFYLLVRCELRLLCQCLILRCEGTVNVEYTSAERIPLVSNTPAL